MLGDERMAIRFVDKTPEDGVDPKATVARPRALSRPSTPGSAAPASVSEAPAPAGADRVTDANAPKLPHPKPVSKIRGRKASPPQAASALAEPAQAPFEGLLPTLPHAKPQPKPRGRKKAFG